MTLANDGRYRAIENVYKALWILFVGVAAHARLINRDLRTACINERDQLRLRGAAPAVSRGELVAAGVLTIPFYFVFPIFWLIPAWRAQRAVNALCALDDAHAQAPVGVRVDLSEAPAVIDEVAVDAVEHDASSAQSARIRG